MMGWQIVANSSEISFATFPCVQPAALKKNQHLGERSFFYN
jgi:hypothetical protein